MKCNTAWSPWAVSHQYKVNKGAETFWNTHVYYRISKILKMQQKYQLKCFVILPFLELPLPVTKIITRATRNRLLAKSRAIRNHILTNYIKQGFLRSHDLVHGPCYESQSPVRNALQKLLSNIFIDPFHGLIYNFANTNGRKLDIILYKKILNEN